MRHNITFFSHKAMILPAMRNTDSSQLSSYHPIMHQHEKGGQQQGQQPQGEKGSQTKISIPDTSSR